MIAVAGALLTLTLRWPGTLPFDALNQLAQARSGQYTDWHPPTMAALWRGLGSGPQSLLILQIACFWGGLWLLALSVAGRWRLAVLALGLSPIALYYNGIVQKDSLFAALLMLVAGLIAKQWRAAAVPVALLAALVRYSGGFAIGPLLTRRHQLWLAPVIGLLCAATLPIAARVLANAERTGVERTLQLYDLAGIAHHSGDRSVLPVPIPRLDQCYTHFFWDTLGEERCGRAFQRVGASLTRTWLGAIVDHPIAYANHRLAHFNRSTFFVVPPEQQCVEAPEMHECGQPQPIKDMLVKNALFWPCTWIAAGLALLLALRPGSVPFSLCLSAIGYAFSYLFFGVASDFRYFFWTEIGVQVALVLALSRGVSMRAPIYAGGIVMLIGYAARVAYLI